MGCKLGAVRGAEPVCFGDVFFEEGGVVLLESCECLGVVDDAFEVFFDSEDHSVVRGVFGKLRCEFGSEGGEGRGVVLVNEVDEACFENHLLGEAGFAPVFDGGVEGRFIGCLHEGFDELVPFVFLLGGKREDERDEEGEKSFHEYKKVGWFCDQPTFKGLRVCWEELAAWNDERAAFDDGVTGHAIGCLECLDGRAVFAGDAPEGIAFLNGVDVPVESGGRRSDRGDIIGNAWNGNGWVVWDGRGIDGANLLILRGGWDVGSGSGWDAVWVPNSCGGCDRDVDLSLVWGAGDEKDGGGE